jgi:Uma2 family endonuclease
MGVFPSIQREKLLTPKPHWPPEQGQWTYKDWLQLPDDGYRYEVIDGVLYMTPLPSILHQRVSLQLIRKLAEFVEQHDLGEVLQAPVGVRLPNQPTPLLPDILFVRAERLDIIGDVYVEGAPDLVMEILSPGNWLYDCREKKQVYQQGGVAEYWIVDPRTETIQVYQLERGGYALLGQYGAGERVQSPGLPGFEVLVDDVFQAR